MAELTRTLPARRVGRAGDRDRQVSVELVTRVAVAWLNNPRHKIAADKVPILVERICAGFATLPTEARLAVGATPEHVPAVTVEESLASKNHILSMIDGRPYKALRLHVAAYGLTPEEYRKRYGLHPTYPMVAENHSATRRELARRIGLTRKRKER